MNEPRYQPARDPESDDDRDWAVHDNHTDSYRLYGIRDEVDVMVTVLNEGGTYERAEHAAVERQR